MERLDCAESAIFLIVNYHFDMETRYLCLGWCFMGVLKVYHKFFKGASRSINECFQKDSNVSALCFKGVLGCFYQKKVSFCVQKSWQLPMQTQLDRNTLRTPLAHPLHTQESQGNTLDIILKYP